MPIITVGKHTIEAINTFWGTEIVKYDGKTKTKAFSMFGRCHHFAVEEDNERITYEVSFTPGFVGVHYAVRRNGIMVFSS